MLGPLNDTAAVTDLNLNAGGTVTIAEIILDNDSNLTALNIDDPTAMMLGAGAAIIDGQNPASILVPGTVTAGTITIFSQGDVTLVMGPTGDAMNNQDVFATGDPGAVPDPGISRSRPSAARSFSRTVDWMTPAARTHQIGALG